MPTYNQSLVGYSSWMGRHLLEQLKILSQSQNSIHHSTVYALPVCMHAFVRAWVPSVCMYMVKAFYKIVLFPQVYRLVKAGEQLHNSKHTFFKNWLMIITFCTLQIKDSTIIKLEMHGEGVAFIQHEAM